MIQLGTTTSLEALFSQCLMFPAIIKQFVTTNCRNIILLKAHIIPSYFFVFSSLKLPSVYVHIFHNSCSLIMYYSPLIVSLNYCIFTYRNIPSKLLLLLTLLSSNCNSLHITISVLLTLIHAYIFGRCVPRSVSPILDIF